MVPIPFIKLTRSYVFSLYNAAMCDFLSFTLDLLIIKKRSSLVIIIVEDVNAREKCMTILCLDIIPLSLLWLDIHINIATPQQPFWFQILYCNDCITWTMTSSYKFLIVSAVSPCQPCLLFHFLRPMQFAKNKILLSPL